MCAYVLVQDDESVIHPTWLLLARLFDLTMGTAFNIFSGLTISKAGDATCAMMGFDTVGCSINVLYATFASSLKHPCLFCRAANYHPTRIEYKSGKHEHRNVSR